MTRARVLYMVGVAVFRTGHGLAIVGRWIMDQGTALFVRSAFL